VTSTVDNIPERNRQVSCMKETYENAEEVIVWLGPELENSALAMAKIAKVIFLD
jgi:Heterokaryon incompatibility protein (HET)